MTTRSFLLAVSRFCDNYTIPGYIYSDNAKTFQTGGKILTDLSTSLNSNEFKEFLGSNKITHAFIPVHSPWYGASYERLISVVKKCAKKLLTEIN